MAVMSNHSEEGTFWAPIAHRDRAPGALLALFLGAAAGAAVIVQCEWPAWIEAACATIVGVPTYFLSSYLATSRGRRRQAERARFEVENRAERQQSIHRDIDAARSSGEFDRWEKKR